MLTYPWKCTVLHCNHVGNTWKPLVLMTWHFDYCPSISEGDNQSVRSSAPVVSRCFPGGYNVKLYISRGRLAWWLLAFLHSAWYNHAASLHNKQQKMVNMHPSPDWAELGVRGISVLSRVFFFFFFFFTNTKSIYWQMVFPINCNKFQLFKIQFTYK